MDVVFLAGTAVAAYVGMGLGLFVFMLLSGLGGPMNGPFLTTLAIIVALWPWLFASMVRDAWRDRSGHD